MFAIDTHENRDEVAGLVQGKRHDVGVSSAHCLQPLLDCIQVLLGIFIECTLLDVIKESPLHVGTDVFDSLAWLYLVEHIQKEVHLISHKIRSSPEMSLMHKLTSHFRGNLNLIVSPFFVRVLQKCRVEVRTSIPQVSEVNIDNFLPFSTDNSKIFNTLHFASFHKPEQRDSANRLEWELNLWTILRSHPLTGACLGSFRI